MLCVLAGCGCGFALNPRHTAWTVRDGFSLGSLYALAQPMDGYLWLGTEFGLFRFDGLRSVPWQPPAGQQLPDEKIYSLSTRAGLRGDRQGRVDSPPRRFENTPGPSGDALVSDLKFTHLTTNDGLSQGYVTAILQDRRGFMWFATRDGLNRYDGNTFVVYKNSPNDPGSLSSNFIQDLIEDDRGYLWVASNTGVNKFDPITERCTRYLHDANNPYSLGGAYVTSIAEDSRGYFWFGTQASGLDKFDPTTGKFTHYRNDSDGQFVGRIAHVIADSHRDVWFVGERGLFRLNQQTAQIARPPATRNGLTGENVYEDELGNLWMLANSPMVGLVKYDPHAERLTRYPLAAGAAGGLASTKNGGSVNSNLLADGQNGLWVASSEGLYYFDRRTERFTYKFQHDESNLHSLDSNAVLSVYRDRGGVLWVGTENAGLNILNFQQQQFVHYRHRPADPNSLSPGRVKAIYRDSNGVLWVGFFPRALDRLDRKAGQITHYVPNPGDENALGTGINVNTIYRDAAGYLWIGGGGSGVDRFDERTGRFKHYRHNPDDPGSLLSDNVISIYGDRNRQTWVGGQTGISRFDPVTGRFTNYLPVPSNPNSLQNWIWAIYQDRSGTLWLGTFGGALIRFDDKAKTFVAYTPDPGDPHRLNGGGITSIHEDRTGTLWVGGFDGLYRYNRQSGAFTRYTESQGLPSSTIRCIQEDGVGRLWLSTQKGISRFDPRTETFRNYDVSDGLQSNEFSDGCYQGPDGEIFFGGSNGFNAFFPENVRDNRYVPPVVITSFNIFNKTVPVGTKSVLKKAIPYVDSLTLSYRENVFSFEFAALSYANSQKNRYRYKLEGFDPGWNEVSSKQRLATYTNLDPRKYVFRVQASNSDGVWNEEGVSLPIVITPPWWNTNWFRALCAAAFMALLWLAYRFRIGQLQEKFSLASEARLTERMSIARELHDSLLQTVQGLMLSLQAVSEMMPAGAAKNKFEKTLEIGDRAIREGRHAVQDLRSASTTSDLTQAVRTLGDELASGDSATFRLVVEGPMRELHPIVRDEVYGIAREALRNAFTHACATRVEAEIGFNERLLQLRIRDDGKGISPDIAEQGSAGHYGLAGMRERARQIGSKLVILSGPETGTEIELSVPGSLAYANRQRRSRFRLFRWNGAG
jgi:ligand-binding sensor domain-containing protein/signal transduction histidine kinase